MYKFCILLCFFPRFGGNSKILKDLIYGKMNGQEAEFRAAALWNAGWEAMYMEGPNYFFPVFANTKENHEVRIAALYWIFHAKPSNTDMSRIMSILQTEKDYEIVNFAYTLFEQFANTINPCYQETREMARFFLKFMKQFGM